MAINQTPIQELVAWNVTTDPPKSELLLSVGHADFGEIPKNIPFPEDPYYPDWSGVLKAQVLAVLEVADVIQESQLSAYVPVESGKTIILATEITRLLTIIAPQIINLPAGADIATRIAAMTETTDYPTGWVLTAVGDAGKNLQIAHTLTGHQTASVTVKAFEGSDGRTLVPFRDAYSGLTENAETIIAEGLAGSFNDLPLEIIILFK